MNLEFLANSGFLLKLYTSATDPIWLINFPADFNHKQCRNKFASNLERLKYYSQKMFTKDTELLLHYNSL